MSDPNLPTAPVAVRKPHKLITHEHTRIDPYYWLRERENPEVIAYLEAENEYTRSVMAHTEALQEKLYQELVGRIQETDFSVPVRKGNCFYYYRTEEAKQYRIYCRKQGGLDAEEEIILDLNALAGESGYLQLGVFKISPDHQVLAYSLDTSGSEDFVVYFKNLETGELFPDQISNTSYGGAWANDNQTYFYTTQDEAKRPHQLLRHQLGSEASEDVLIFQENDPQYRVSIDKTRDDAYLMLYLRSVESGEWHYLDANNPLDEFVVVQPREKDHQYSTAHHSGKFYILTNDGAKNYKLVTAPVSAPGREHWEPFIPHREDVKLDDIDLFVRHLVVYKRQNGLQAITIMDLATGKVHDIAFPEPVYSYSQEGNPEFETDTLRFTYTSMTTPDSVYDYGLDSREMVLKKRKPVLGGFEPENYTSQRLFATASDGTQVPISLVYRKETPLDGSAPCVLYGYGSYGYSIDPAFLINPISLLDRGFVFAIAHIRGGEEMGRYWYDQGKFLNKRNTFTDFIACGNHLVAERFTNRERLVIMGGSAGGLLMGAVLNLAPQFCRAAVAKVPFVDVVTTMLDETIPLTVNEFEEWGNPKDKPYYDYMLSYSPYDNVEAREYPDILVTAGLNDPRVQYWEPAKWVAKLRAVKTDTNRLLLKTNMGAGHGGASGRYDYLREIAFEYAFILDVLGAG